jgi:hypothetical protein
MGQLSTLLLTSGCGCLAACGAREGAGAGTAAGAVWFEEVSAPAGLDFRHSPGQERRYLFPEIMGSGLGFADVDGDGALELFAVQSGEISAPADSPTASRLFRNRRDGTFSDASASSGIAARGYGMGCTFGDADGDGAVDLYLTNLGPDAFFRNLGDGRFEDASARTGLGDPAWGTSAAFVDYDADGDLDLFVVNYVSWAPEREIECSSSYGLRDYCSPRNYRAPAPDSLYRNEGELSFRDVSEQAGIRANPGNGLGIACEDFDLDGRMDVFVANDLTPNALWLGQADGTFRDGALLAGCALNGQGKAEAGMGVAAFDLQEDGDTDLFVTHLDGETNTLFQNDGGRFRDRTDVSGLGPPSFPFTGFGTGAVDFDHDGWLDLYVANGRVTRAPPGSRDPFAESDQLFRSLDGERFEEVLPRGGVLPGRIGSGRGAAFGDYDQDGDVDVAVSDNGGRLALLRNVAARGHWIQLRVLGSEGSDALGATLWIDDGTVSRRRSVGAAYSYCSSSDPCLHLGLGARTGPVAVEVRWRDGTEESFGPLAADEKHVLRRGAGRR